MRLHRRFAILVTLGFSFALGVSSACADAFNWNNITYAPTAAQATDPAGISLGNSANGNNSAKIYFTLSSNTANSAPTFAAVTGVNYPSSSSYSQNNGYYVSGGLADTQKALQIGANFSGTTNAITQTMLVSLIFAKPVVSVSFSFFDVDIQPTGTGNYIDRISAIQGSNGAGGAAVIPAVAAASTTPTFTVSGNTLTASTNNAQNLANGNATVTFNSTTPIDRFSFVYDNNYKGGGGGTVQIIGLSDITFTTPVPEPGTMVVVGLGCAGLAGTALRRRYR